MCHYNVVKREPQVQVRERKADSSRWPRYLRTVEIIGKYRRTLRCRKQSAKDLWTMLDSYYIDKACMEQYHILS